MIGIDVHGKNGDDLDRHDDKIEDVCDHDGDDGKDKEENDDDDDQWVPICGSKL